MPKFHKTDSSLADNIDEKLREELWGELSEIAKKTSFLAGTPVSRQLYGEFAKTLENHPDVVEQAKETLIHTFAGTNDYVQKSLTENNFEFTPEAMEQLLRTLSVSKDGRESSYHDIYGIPKVTEENMNAVAVHLALNITNGDLAKNFEKSGPEQVSMSQYKIPGVSGYGKYPPAAVQPFAKQVKKEQTKIEPVEKPKKPSFFTNALGKFQRLIHIKGKARDAVETYERKLSEWKRYDESVNQVNRNADRINSGRQNKRNEISEENLKGADQAYLEAQKNNKRGLTSLEVAEMHREANDQFRQLYAGTSLTVSNLTKFKMSDDSVKQIREDIGKLDGLLGKIPNNQDKKESLDNLRQQFSDNMKQQQILRGNVKDTNSRSIEEKLGVNNTKQTTTHSRTHTKNNSPERQNSMG